MNNWSKTAFIFPGQGSQRIGMGKALAATYTSARETFQEADDLLGMALSSWCFDGPEAVLSDTINTQPALYVTSIAAMRALQHELPTAQPAATAGHSLGELTALTAAGALSFADGLQLVRTRGHLMQQAGERSPGAMAALLGADIATADTICTQAQADTGKSVVVANDNSPGQVVISGHIDALDRAVQLAQENGIRRVVKLNVSIAAHSPLMVAANTEFAEAVDQTAMREPEIPVFANVTAAPLHSIESLRQELREQLTKPVRWSELITAMIASGITRFIELGSGDVLTRLLRRIDRSVAGAHVDNPETLEFVIGH